MNSNPWNLIDGLGGKRLVWGNWTNVALLTCTTCLNRPKPIGKAARTQFEQKRAAVERACDSLGVSSPQSRCFDPVPQAALSGLPSLPPAVAESIEEVSVRWNRRCVTDVRRVTNDFRKACQPLGEFKVTTARTQKPATQLSTNQLELLGKVLLLAAIPPRDRSSQWWLPAVVEPWLPIDDVGGIGGADCAMNGPISRLSWNPQGYGLLVGGRDAFRQGC